MGRRSFDRLLVPLLCLAGTAVGCAFGGGGWGLLAGVVVLAVSGLLAMGTAGTGCFSQACLSIERDYGPDDAEGTNDVGDGEDGEAEPVDGGPCLAPYPDDAGEVADDDGGMAEVCLSPPLDADEVGEASEEDGGTAEACLRPPIDAGDEGGEAEPVDAGPCLSPPMDAGEDVKSASATGPGGRLAAAGLLSAEQVERLERLRRRG